MDVVRTTTEKEQTDGDRGGNQVAGRNSSPSRPTARSHFNGCPCFANRGESADRSYGITDRWRPAKTGDVLVYQVGAAGPARSCEK
jgi:hypothetical protein